MAVEKRRWLPYLVYPLLSLAVLWSLLLPGYILTLDMLFTPNMDSTTQLYGLSESISARAPLELLIQLVSHVMPSWLLQKVILFLVFFLSVYRATALREARRLEERFGDAYRAYAARVPRFMPRMRAYPAGEEGAVSGGFSWAQYGRNREWEAGLGALAGFGFLVLKMTLLG